MGRRKDQLLCAFIQILIGYIRFEQLRIQEKGIVNAVVEGLLFAFSILCDHMDSADIGVHALDILQKLPHIPFALLFHGIRRITFPEQNLPEMVEGQIARLRSMGIKVIKIRHFRYGIVGIQHGFYAGGHVSGRLLILSPQRK